MKCLWLLKEFGVDEGHRLTFREVGVSTSLLCYAARETVQCCLHCNGSYFIPVSCFLHPPLFPQMVLFIFCNLVGLIVVRLNRGRP